MLLEAGAKAGTASLSRRAAIWTACVKGHREVALLLPQPLSLAASPHPRYPLDRSLCCSPTPAPTRSPRRRSSPHDLATSSRPLPTTSHDTPATSS